MEVKCEDCSAPWRQRRNFFSFLKVVRTQRVENKVLGAGNKDSESYIVLLRAVPTVSRRRGYTKKSIRRWKEEKRGQGWGSLRDKV